MNDAENIVFLREMLSKLGGAGGQLGPDPRAQNEYDLLAQKYLPPNPMTGGVSVGMGNSQLEPELMNAAGIGSAFGGAPAGAGLPIDQISNDVRSGALSPELLQALEALLSVSMNNLAQRKMGVGIP